MRHAGMDDARGAVLVVIDMQNGFLNESSKAIIEPVSKLVESARSRGIPVVFTRFRNEEGGPYERLIGWTRLRCSPEVDIAPELESYATTVIDKTMYSAFTDEFETLVAKESWSTVILCGVATDGCVLKTAVDAFERGLVPLVVRDACASHAGTDIHEAGLLLLARFIGRDQIVATGELLAALDDHS